MSWSWIGLGKSFAVCGWFDTPSSVWLGFQSSHDSSLKFQQVSRVSWVRSYWWFCSRLKYFLLTEIWCTLYVFNKWHQIDAQFAEAARVRKWLRNSLYFWAGMYLSLHVWFICSDRDNQSKILISEKTLCLDFQLKAVLFSETVDWRVAIPFMQKSLPNSTDGEKVITEKKARPFLDKKPTHILLLWPHPARPEWSICVAKDFGSLSWMRKRRSTSMNWLHKVDLNSLWCLTILASAKSLGGMWPHWSWVWGILSPFQITLYTFGPFKCQKAGCLYPRPCTMLCCNFVEYHLGQVNLWDPHMLLGHLLFFSMKKQMELAISGLYHKFCDWHRMEWKKHLLLQSCCITSCFACWSNSGLFNQVPIEV